MHTIMHFLLNLYLFALAIPRPPPELVIETHPTTVIVVPEQTDLVVHHLTSEHGVNEEDRRDKLLVLRVDRLVNVAVREERAHVRQVAKDGVLDGSLCL